MRSLVDRLFCTRAVAAPCLLLAFASVCYADFLEPPGHPPLVPALAPPQAPSISPPRIALLHMYDGVHFFRRLGALTGENKARYARRHGYDMIVRGPDKVQGLFKRSEECPGNQRQPCWVDDHNFSIDSSRAPTFGKIKLAIAACNNRPNAWLLWSDADAIIVNQTVPLEHIIDDGYDVILSYDWLMVQAGVLLFKCTPWSLEFLSKTYDDRTFDKARALDQSAVQAYLDKLTKAELEEHVKVVPKYAMNVYLEEYRPGDFLIHMAGKLYEATEPGLWAIANQFDVFSTVEDVRDIQAFFQTKYLLNKYSGLCPIGQQENQHDCKPGDYRRMKLKEPLQAISNPNRYRHVGMRYYFLQNWSDKYDTPLWTKKRKSLVPHSSFSSGSSPHIIPPMFVPEARSHGQSPKLDGNQAKNLIDLPSNVGLDSDVVHNSRMHVQRSRFWLVLPVLAAAGIAVRTSRHRQIVDNKRR
jgi:hypothetical protein